MNGFLNGYALLVEADKMFLNKNYSTIDAALTPDTESPIGSTDLVLGDGVKNLLAYIAVHRDFPEEILQKHFAKLAASTNFFDFARIVRVKLASMTLSKVPVRPNIEKMFRYGALPDLTYAISKMSAEELAGLLDYAIDDIKSIDSKLSIAIMSQIYTLKMIPRETFLFAMAVCCRQA